MAGRKKRTTGDRDRGSDNDSSSGHSQSVKRARRRGDASDSDRRTDGSGAFPVSATRGSTGGGAPLAQSTGGGPAGSNLAPNDNEGADRGKLSPAPPANRGPSASAAAALLASPPQNRDKQLPRRIQDAINRSPVTRRKQVMNPEAQASARADVTYAFVDALVEDHGQPLYAVAFNTIDPKCAALFATAGHRRATVYECAGSEIVPIQVYEDEDTDEVFYACCWTYDVTTGAPLLAVGGAAGIIKVIDLALGTVVSSMAGHGDSIYDLAIHPTDGNTLISASKDFSVRLWNVRARRCACIFSGVGGHRGEVLSCDFNAAGDRILTTGVDHTIKIWAVDKQAVASITRSSTYVAAAGTKPYAAHIVVEPVFSTATVHPNYVDCARFVGNTILSKSIESKVVRWMPRTTQEGKHVVDVVKEYPYADSAVWFIKFGMDPEASLLAVGNTKGAIFVFDVDAYHSGGQTQPVVHLRHSQSSAVVRMTAFSADAATLVAVTEDGKVFRYDQQTKRGGKRKSSRRKATVPTATATATAAAADE